MSSSGGNFLSTEDEESTQPSQEDHLKSEAEDLEDEDQEDNIELAEPEPVLSHSPTPDQNESKVDPICPDSDGYFVIKSSNFKQGRPCCLTEFLKAQ